MVRVTVNVPEAAAAVPEIKKRMLDAGVRGAAHRRLPLQRSRPADEVSRDARRRSTSTASTPATSARARGATSSSRRSATSRATTAKPVRIGVNGGSLNQELVMEKMQENTDQRPRPLVRRDRQRVHGPLGAPVDRARAPVGPAQGPDHHLVQGLAAARPHRRLPRPRDEDRPAAAPRPDRGRNGDEGPRLVRVRDGRAARTRASATRSASRSTPRPGGDRREEVYAACELLQSLGIRSFAPSRDGLPRLRPHDVHDVPGARRAHPGLRPRPDAGLEDAVRRRRDDDARRDGLHRQRSRRVQGRERSASRCPARARSRAAPSTSTARSSRR